MANVWNFVIEYWYYVLVGMLILPNLLWQLFAVIFGGFQSAWDNQWTEKVTTYHYFWRTCVKLDGVLSNWGWKDTLRKLGVLINLITLFWVWGYIATLVVAAISFIARWGWWAIKGFFGGLWKLIRNGWEAI